MEGELYLTDIDTNPEVSKKLPPRGRMEILNHNFWRKTIQRVNSLKDEDYYEGKKIKPGMNFFKILLESYEQPSPSIESIRINLPETICMQSNRYNIIYSRDRSLYRVTEASFQEFERMVVPVECTSHRENRESCPLEGQGAPLSAIQMLRCCPDYPIFISRSSSGTSFMKHVVTATEYKMKQLPTNDNELYQRYIVPYDFRANVVRLHFFTKNSRSQQRSFAYKIVNVSPMFSVEERKTLGSHNFTVNFDRENSFKYLVIKGKAIEQYEKMAESIVTYLEHCKEVVIRYVVLDFTMDYWKTPWLIGLKMVRYDNKSLEPFTPEERTRQMEEITFSVTCRLCGVFFHKDSVRKMLTYKLLFELMEHLRKRNLALPEIKVNESSTIYCPGYVLKFAFEQINESS